MPEEKIRIEIFGYEMNDPEPKYQKSVIVGRTKLISSARVGLTDALKKGCQDINIVTTEITK